MSDGITLVVRRVIRATPHRLFEAWTSPEQLRTWWGPAGVACIEARVDLRVGGRYRLGNQLPDGRVVWIEGEFESITPPSELVYSWRSDPASPARERVTVRFEAREGGTEVIVLHQRIPDGETRQQHQEGWSGCLEGLERYLAAG
jgi:uncharacterized protein YndB with AHSA1/START domain